MVNKNIYTTPLGELSFKERVRLANEPFGLLFHHIPKLKLTYLYIQEEMRLKREELWREYYKNKKMIGSRKK